MWKVRVEYDDGTVKTIEVKSKYAKHRAKMEYDTYIEKWNVKDVAVFDDDGDYVGITEL